MSNLSNIDTKLPAEGPKHKRVINSPRLEEKYNLKGQVDNLPSDSKPNPTETFGVVPTTSIAHNFLTHFYFFLVIYF